ncbi:unnamed protein product [Closterium sp. NIES-53]
MPLNLSQSLAVPFNPSPIPLELSGPCLSLANHHLSFITLIKFGSFDPPPPSALPAPTSHARVLVLLCRRGTGTGRHRDSEGSGGEGEEGGGDGRKVRQQVTERDLFGESSEEDEEGGDAGRKPRKASRSPQGTPLASPHTHTRSACYCCIFTCHFTSPLLLSPTFPPLFPLPPPPSVSISSGTSRIVTHTCLPVSCYPPHSPSLPPSSPRPSQQRHGYESEEEQRHERGGYDEEGRWDEEGGERRRPRERPKGPPLDLDLSLFDPPAPPDKMVMVMASNIVGIQAAPFDPDTYEEGGPQNLIRWRHVRRPDGSMGVSECSMG